MTSQHRYECLPWLTRTLILTRSPPFNRDILSFIHSGLSALSLNELRNVLLFVAHTVNRKKKIMRAHRYVLWGWKWICVLAGDCESWSIIPGGPYVRESWYIAIKSQIRSLQTFWWIYWYECWSEEISTSKCRSKQTLEDAGDHISN